MKVVARNRAVDAGRTSPGPDESGVREATRIDPMSDGVGQSHQTRSTGGLAPGGGGALPFVLAINGGSSSLKYALFSTAGPIERVVSGRVERIGRGESRLVV